MAKAKQKLVVIDSNALIHRAYHALPPLTTKDGTLTNAVYGYVLTLLNVLDKIKPDYIVATFDLAGPTFRHEQYKEYKATRTKAPDELYAQIPLAKDLLKAFNIPVYEKAGYEADDVIGTIVKDPQIDGGLEKIIVTGDLDSLQLIDKNTKVFTLKRGITDTVLYDEEKVMERYGLKPRQIIDFKALRGDQSDNIPGVKGIGEKTAIELLLKYKNLEGVYKNVDFISSESVKKKLLTGKKDAFMSYDLAQIKTDVSVDFDLKKCVAVDYDKQELLDFFKKMEFYSLVKRLGGEIGSVQDKKKKSGAKDFIDFGKVKISLVTKEKEAGDLLKVIKKEKKFSFSFSKEQEKSTLPKPSGLGIYISKNNAGYFIGEDSIENFSEVFQDEAIMKIGYDLKYSIKLFSGADKTEKVKNYFDVLIGAYLLKSGSNLALDKLIFEEFGAEMKNKVTKQGQASLLNDNSETEQKQVVEEAFWLMQLQERYEKEIEEVSQKQKKEEKGAKDLKWVMDDLEMPLVEILSEMEIAGIKADKKKLKEVSDLAQKEISELEKKIYELAGEEFNINSPSQLAPILYEKLKIPTEGIKRGKTGFSTDADQLRKIYDLHPIVPLIDQYREIFKIKTTYADSLPNLVADDGRIHTHFNQAVAATGRLSSSDPNLQNIPKRGKLAEKIRQAFISDNGYTLISADYSQIDLRVAAHLSGDPRMIEIFKKGKDIHRATAAWVNDVAESEITSKQRREAKSLNFGVLYGMGTYGFMRDSGVSKKRAEFFIDQYMKKFSGLKKYLEETKEFARKNGYVETELGRRRYIGNINASNFQVRSAAERMAINLPVQGLAADIMKLAMLAAEKEVLEKYRTEEARMILQIHDELIFEVKNNLAEKFMKEIKIAMEGVYELKVPLIVEVTKGNDWSEL